MASNEGGTKSDTSTTSTSGVAVAGGAWPSGRPRWATGGGGRNAARRRSGGVLSQQPLDTRDHVAPGFDLSQCRAGADANRFVQCRVVATGLTPWTWYRNHCCQLHPPTSGSSAAR